MLFLITCTDIFRKKYFWISSFLLFVLVFMGWVGINLGLNPNFTNNLIADDLTFLHVTSNQNKENGSNLGRLGSYTAWEKISIIFSGPYSNGLEGKSNPFQIFVDVHFLSPEGQVIIVPAFYNGNGKGNLVGSQWKVHFSTGFPGEWSFTTASDEPLLNGVKGIFTVTPSPNCNTFTERVLPYFNCTGRLEYTGGHYLKFSNGEYWIKGGVDDPENFLGNAFGDWDAKKKAIDYLSGQGVNSIYVITNNIDGDRQDTWPWFGETLREAKSNSDRFDISRLQLWDDFFSYVQNKGIVLHIVLNDDSAWHGYDHVLYYREMVARFGYHPALIWNIGEEANEIYSDRQQVLLAGALQKLDPYNHPVTAHRKAEWPFLGQSNFDITSIQLGDGASNFSSAKLGEIPNILIDHREKGSHNGRPIPIMVDETPRVTVVDEVSRRKMRTQVLYPIYLTGGNFELHFYDRHGQGGKLSLQDLSPMLEDMYLARKFLEAMPFYEMEPCPKTLIEGRTSYCYQKRGTVYGVYLPEGGSIFLNLIDYFGIFSTKWYNPRTGENIYAGNYIGGRKHSLSTPDNEDWALLIWRSTSDMRKPVPRRR